MPTGKSTNTIERRAEGLAAAIGDRINHTYRALTEPTPAFQVKKSPEDQVNEYIRLTQSGQLGTLRESQGGPYTDDQVDQYVAHMERLVPKHAARLFNQDPMS